MNRNGLGRQIRRRNGPRRPRRARGRSRSDRPTPLESPSGADFPSVAGILALALASRRRIVGYRKNPRRNT